ncbi:hypothetical protein BIV57_21805 [Mangrovactinospora gilvigrisea]|uniref:Helix-hairpin-helix DNA-binding motif class 1 domain-containing protein n=1 Tax=Mangrovactinospora gilvigrisea TaxID=1428644 RepID=A0A1J7C1E7_9ACTN|nr:helix-hairpin-helix domain-containing protein [Mangrovactinospora gilvigrisea]OIV35396.1 hypothetical protein BIV57_21805 [Mangrovactinospora gilvigrisea]
MAEELSWWERARLAVGERVRLGRGPLVVLAVLCAAALAVAGWRYWDGRPEAVAPPRPVAAAAAAVHGPEPQGTRLVVDVVGKVRRPGVVQLPAGSRVADAVRAAGGATEARHEAGLNLARRLVDGEQLRVGEPAASPAGSDGAADGASGGRVSLSNATEQQLEQLPGVGPALAQHIIGYRTAHSGFATVEALRQVPGIGPHRYTQIAPLVTP